MNSTGSLETFMKGEFQSLKPLLRTLNPLPIYQLRKFQQLRLSETPKIQKPLKNFVKNLENFQQSKNMEHQIQPQQNSNLTGLVKDLNTNLSTLQPNNSETTKLITYALLATAVVGVAVYHYNREQERND